MLCTRCIHQWDSTASLGVKLHYTTHYYIMFYCRSSETIKFKDHLGNILQCYMTHTQIQCSIFYTQKKIQSNHWPRMKEWLAEQGPDDTRLCTRQVIKKYPWCLKCSAQGNKTWSQQERKHTNTASHTEVHTQKYTLVYKQQSLGVLM